MQIRQEKASLRVCKGYPQKQNRFGCENCGQCRLIPQGSEYDVSIVSFRQYHLCFMIDVAVRFQNEESLLPKSVHEVRCLGMRVDARQVTRLRVTALKQPIIVC